MTRYDERQMLECLAELKAVTEKVNSLFAKYQQVPKSSARVGSRGQSVTGGGSSTRTAARGDGKAPYFRTQKGAWHAWVDGRQVSLGVRGEDNRTAAEVAFRTALAARNAATSTPVPNPSPAAVGPNVADICAAFLSDCTARTKLPDGPQRMEMCTVRTWRLMLKRFAAEYGPEPFAALDRDAVVRWACGYGKSNASVNTLLGAVVACARWAHRTKRLRENPLDGLQKLPQPSRGAKVALTAEQFTKLREAASYDAFRTFLDGMWHTGCRPGEIAALTAADVDLVAGVATLTRHKSGKKTGLARFIFLSADALALFRLHAEQWPAGALFRNSQKQPWRPAAWGRVMRRARKAAGLPQAICYGLRHSYATAALVKGVPDATVAALLGHSGTTMLHKHYSHLTSRAQVMRDAAQQVHPA